MNDDLYDLIFRLTTEALRDGRLDSRRYLIRAVEQPMIDAALALYRGNKSQAASRLGMSRQTLDKRLREFQGRYVVRYSGGREELFVTRETAERAVKTTPGAILVKEPRGDKAP